MGDKDNDETPAETRPKLKASIRHAQKKELEEKGRSKPDITKDRAKEKILCKLATKGVVQLFNAVREQQKSIKTQLNVASLGLFEEYLVSKEFGVCVTDILVSTAVFCTDFWFVSTLRND